MQQRPTASSEYKWIIQKKKKTVKVQLLSQIRFYTYYYVKVFLGLIAVYQAF